MKVIVSVPPNYLEIKQHLQPSASAVFCYGDTIFSPSAEEIPADIEYHESIHQTQQGDNPEMWWKRYLIDPQFRFDQELEAYAHQYLFVKGALDDKAAKEALQEMAENLASPQYALRITVHGAATEIRLRAKAMV